ncbi:hypothetical protein KC926_03685 [Candidatus Kaiserbacteria bacterium]|nr:hypothetical protein [Candidatus Kaiserbacteria bacterium]
MSSESFATLTIGDDVVIAYKHGSVIMTTELCSQLYKLIHPELFKTKGHLANWGRTIKKAKATEPAEHFHEPLNLLRSRQNCKHSIYALVFHPDEGRIKITPYMLPS